MTTLRLTALSARTMAFCLPLDGARYHLPAPASWTLRSPAREHSGLTGTSVTVLHDLEPDTDYVLAVTGQTLDFHTPPCAGLVRIDDHGAEPDGPDTAAHAAENARAVTRAIAAVPVGGTLLVPAGTWVCAPVALKSDMTLQLAEGATLFAPTDRTGWPILPARSHTGRMLGSWEGLPEACHAAPIYAVGAQNLTIAGPGLLDGGGTRADWWSWHKETRNGARRPRGLHLIDCRNTRLIGFGIQNAPSWTLHPQGCHDLTIAGLHIRAPHDSPNTDGCNPEMCQNVLIEGVRFSVGDDCIAIKAGKRTDTGDAEHLAPTRHITIRHCLMERGHGGVVMGSEMSGEITDITVTACEMIGTDRGLRIKTRRGRGGTVDRIRFHNVLMNGVETAFSANAHYFCDADGHSDWVQSRLPAPVDDLTPHIGRIEVSDIVIHDLSHAIGAFLGLPEAPIGPVKIRDVVVTSLNETAVPCPPLMADHIRPLLHAGVVAEHTLLDLPDDLPVSGDLSMPAPTQRKTRCP